MTSFLVLAGFAGTGMVGLYFGRKASQIQLLGQWLLISALPCSLFYALHHTPLSHEAAGSIGFTPLFPGYRQIPLHEINQPKGNKKQIIILGASNMAGWEADYRGSFTGQRHKHDVWGRASLGTALITELASKGVSARSANLGIPSGEMLTELSIFLYSMERHPDLVVHGICAPSFKANYKGHAIPEVPNELRLRLAQWEYPDKQKLEAALLKTLSIGTQTTLQPTLSPTLMDGVIGKAGQNLLATYHRIGLPPLTVKIEDPLLSDSEWNRVNTAPLGAWYVEHQQAALTTYADVQVIMSRIAEKNHVPYVVVLPPDSNESTKPWNAEFGEMLRSKGVHVIDLTRLGLRYGTQTYDGTHSTPVGNQIFAAALLKELSDKGIFP